MIVSIINLELKVLGENISSRDLQVINFGPNENNTLSQIIQLIHNKLRPKTNMPWPNKYYIHRCAIVHCIYNSFSYTQVYTHK